MKTPTDAEEFVLNRIDSLISQRCASYGNAVHTSVLLLESGKWRNLLTTIRLTQVGLEVPKQVFFDYGDVIIVCRPLPPEGCRRLLERAAFDGIVDTNERELKISNPLEIGIVSEDRRLRSEWNKWPADIFTFQRLDARMLSGIPSLVRLGAPYFPSLEHVLLEYFGFTTPGWTNYFREQTVVILPNFRARIAALTIGVGFLRAHIECLSSDISDFVLKVYASFQSDSPLQRTIDPVQSDVQVELSEKPNLASVALIDRTTGQKLDEKTFQHGAMWHEPDVGFETSAPEIEQMLMIGESETIEFRRELRSDKQPPRLAKTAVAFANTKGGVIVFGVDDDHHPVGCETTGMADTFTNILRTHCEPVPRFKGEDVDYEGKKLFLVRISESDGPVYTVKEHGPYIRSNGTNRAPTSQEIDSMFRSHPAQRLIDGA